jgi:16S rRNA processing protein RimM
VARDAAKSRGERLVVGLVRGIHGLRGAVRVEILSDDESRFQPGSVVYPEGTDTALTVSWRRDDAPGPGVLIRFREIQNRSAAERIQDTYLEAEPRPEALPEGAFYWHQIVGARVETTDGEELGTVDEVFRAGEGEVFSVTGGRRGEVLVPAVSAVVRELAPAEGRIVVDPEALDLEPDRPRRPRGRRSSKAAKPAAANADAPAANADAVAPNGHDRLAQE